MSTSSSLAAAAARRRFLGSSLSLSAGAVALLGGMSGRALAASADPIKDAAILNVALGLEHEAINAYQLGASSGLLQATAMNVAVQFQSHHKAHRDALIAAIRSLGGTPVAEKPMAEYAKALNAEQIRSQGDILALAARLELGAANAYLGVIPAFTDPALSKVSGRLAAAETMHWTALSGALARALPMHALTFGA